MKIGRVPRSLGFPPHFHAFPTEHVSPIRDISAVPRAISRQVAPISHIILSVCVARISTIFPYAFRGLGRACRVERAHLILKGFMRHFPFILTTNDGDGQGRERSGVEQGRAGGAKVWMANENSAPLMKFSLNRICDAWRTATEPTHG